MAKSRTIEKKKVLPCAAYLEGEYGINGLFVGVPVKLGARGIEQIYQVKLTAEEQAMLKKSADAVEELVEKAKDRLSQLTKPERVLAALVNHGMLTEYQRNRVESGNMFGLAFGRGDPEAAANACRTTREPLATNVTFV